MPKVGVITDVFDWREVLGDLPGEASFWAPTRTGLPTAEQLAGLDTIIIVGQLDDRGVATQLSGVVKLGLERSKGTLAFAYPVHAVEADEAFLSDFGHTLPYGNAPNGVFGYPAEFHAYFTEYGISGAGFSDHKVKTATVIGYIHENAGATVPTALCWEIEELGVVYLVPYHLSRGGSPAHMVGVLYAAVTAHRDVLAAGLPAYLSDVRLGATEEDLLAKIDQMELALAETRAEAAALARWRHLIGRTSGKPLVELVLEALNVVLDGTGYEAETRPDVGAEDFWIAGPDEDFALAEAKGIAGGIARANVGQVDSHREERGLPPEFPGLLIVNAFRGDADLERKQNEDIAPNVISLARAQNVVVLRTWDLYQLVGRRIDGLGVGNDLLSALREDEGGWLQVDDQGIATVR